MKGTPVLLVLMLAVVSMSLSSCGAAKMAQYMDQHKMNLAKAIGGNLTGEEKLDIVANSVVTALNESMTYGSTRKTIQHFSKYSKTNEKALNTIIKDVDGWMKNMSPAEKISVFTKLAQKPYAKELINVVPKFEKKVNRKIKTFSIASKLLGVLKPKIF